MENTEVKIKEVETLKLSKGDVLVIKLSTIQSVNSIRTFKMNLEEIFPDNRVLILPNTAKISKIVKEE